MNKLLHIVSFDIPFPTNYGGVIDVFYRLKTLQTLGFEVHLHCFEYNDRKQQEVLNKICKKVFYYPRKKWFNPFGKLPYIVSSRKSAHLLQNLIAVEAPILFEGLHCCGYLDHAKLRDRQKLVRMHNIEHDYYSNLSKKEPNWLKKFYYGLESNKLCAFEPILSFASHVLAISPKDTDTLKIKFPKTTYIPAFHTHTAMSSTTGKGNYCLYHGNLKVSENEKAALFLVNEVFSQLPIDLIIAGNGASPRLQKAIKPYPNIRWIENPSQSELDQLITKAHIHVLPTFQDTGIKLKLINVLFQGRFVMVNPIMVNETGLESLCLIQTSISDWISNIPIIMDKPFGEHEISNRQKILLDTFNNLQNGLKIEDLLKVQ